MSLHMPLFSCGVFQTEEVHLLRSVCQQVVAAVEADRDTSMRIARLALRYYRLGLIREDRLVEFLTEAVARWQANSGRS